MHTHVTEEFCLFNVASVSFKLVCITIMLGQKQLENVECFNYLGSMLTNDGRCFGPVVRQNTE